MTSILITGVTGTIGGEIARQLRAQGRRIRVLVRDASRYSVSDEGVNVTIGEFADPQSLNAAFDGIERLFLASFDRPDQPDLQRNVLVEAKKHDVRHVVRMSTIAVHEKQHIPIFRWHGICERQLEDSGLAFTHLRPSWVMQNFLSFVTNDMIRLPAGHGRTSFVDARDIAAVAVEALTKPGHEGNAYELTGPEALSHLEVAKHLSAATGRPIIYETISPEAYEREKMLEGWPHASIDSLLALFADMRENVEAGVTDAVERVTGRTPHKFQEFARDYAEAFRLGG